RPGLGARRAGHRTLAAGGPRARHHGPGGGPRRPPHPPGRPCPSPGGRLPGGPPDPPPPARSEVSVMTENEPRRRPWWPRAVGAVVVIAAPVLIHFGPVVRSSGPVDVGPEERGAVRTAVVCHGHVDVEDGVTALNPVQPGRVVEVAVREGQAVKAG